MKNGVSIADNVENSMLKHEKAARAISISSWRGGKATCLWMAALWRRTYARAREGPSNSSLDAHCSALTIINTLWLSTRHASFCRLSRSWQNHRWQQLSSRAWACARHCARAILLWAAFALNLIHQHRPLGNHASLIWAQQACTHALARLLRSCFSSVSHALSPARLTSLFLHTLLLTSVFSSRLPALPLSY